jgi:hypothetical protein
VNEIQPDRFLFIGVSILILVIGADSSSTRFSVRIRGHFHRRLEIGEISPAASRAQARTRLHRHDDGGCWLGRCRSRAGTGPLLGRA